MFAIGSAVSGSAPNTAALIAGRTIQGIGGGGINVMTEILVCDLCPLRERAKYRVTWRWIFYMNLPIAGVALVLLFIFLRVQYRKDTSGRGILRRIDFGGNALLILSVIATLVALTYGGTLYPWGSWRTIVPLVLGALGLVAFLALQSTSYIPEPTMPLRMFANRTSLAGFALTFIHSILIFQITYYLPLYFQSLKNASPTASGVYVLPTSIAAMPFAICAGIGLSKLGKYRPIMLLGCIFLSVSFGLFSMLDAKSITAFWIGIQFLGAAGVGVLLPTTLPAVQAPLEDADTAAITATWGFLRAFGGVWGISVPATVFNSRVNQLANRVPDPHVQQLLINGGAYARASREFLHSLDPVPTVKAAVISVYTDALQLTWQVGIGFSVLAFLTVFVLKEVPMREHLETDFGLDAPKSVGPQTDDGAPLSGAERESDPSNLPSLEKGL
ncbi:MFS general substrate transporter [Viridothelium virens]|uniref:MFS general substrate transporter n=1 Tax=Viridothelium virens TaxID=1048519 RepID=A0A6A6HBL5_VIRVR|nr:MFS general substrate transporter [Viridothelium virens]